jgi:hypothetical protein
METPTHQMQLYLREDGTFLLNKPEGAGSESFDTLLSALNCAHSLSPKEDYHLLVFDAEGRKIIETFV